LNWCSKNTEVVGLDRWVDGLMGVKFVLRHCKVQSKTEAANVQKDIVSQDFDVSK
jgi:hypothetical protein